MYGFGTCPTWLLGCVQTLENGCGTARTSQSDQQPQGSRVSLWPFVSRVGFSREQCYRLLRSLTLLVLRYPWQPVTGGNCLCLRAAVIPWRIQELQTPEEETLIVDSGGEQGNVTSASFPSSLLCSEVACRLFLGVHELGMGVMVVTSLGCCWSYVWVTYSDKPWTWNCVLKQLLHSSSPWPCRVHECRVFHSGVQKLTPAPEFRLRW